MYFAYINDVTIISNYDSTNRGNDDPDNIDFYNYDNKDKEILIIISLFGYDKFNSITNINRYKDINIYNNPNNLILNLRIVINLSCINVYEYYCKWKTKDENLCLHYFLYLQNVFIFIIIATQLLEKFKIISLIFGNSLKEGILFMLDLSNNRCTKMFVLRVDQLIHLELWCPRLYIQQDYPVYHNFNNNFGIMNNL